jgi:hypothetical protein
MRDALGRMRNSWWTPPAYTTFAPIWVLVDGRSRLLNVAFHCVRMVRSNSGTSWKRRRLRLRWLHCAACPPFKEAHRCTAEQSPCSSTSTSSAVARRRTSRGDQGSFDVPLHVGADGLQRNQQRIGKTSGDASPAKKKIGIQIGYFGKCLKGWFGLDFYRVFHAFERVPTVAFPVLHLRPLGHLS